MFSSFFCLQQQEVVAGLTDYMITMREGGVRGGRRAWGRRAAQAEDVSGPIGLVCNVVNTTANAINAAGVVRRVVSSGGFAWATGVTILSTSVVGTAAAVGAVATAAAAAAALAGAAGSAAASGVGEALRDPLVGEEELKGGGPE